MKKTVQALADFWVAHNLTFPMSLVAMALAVALSVTAGAALGDHAPQLLSGATFLAAAMVNALLRVWTWADATDAQVARLHGHVRREQSDRDELRDRFRALERVQTIAAVATVLSILLIITLIVAIVYPPIDGNPDPTIAEWVTPTPNVVASRVAIALSAGLAVFLLGIVAETASVGYASIRGSRTIVGSQSGPHG